MSDHVRGSRQARAAGVLVGVVGLWGALIPFVGPTFGYSMGGVPAWTWSESHLTLHLAPGVVAVLGAVLLMRRQRARQVVGALLGIVGGTWFVIAPSLHPLWAESSMGGMSHMGGSALSGALSGLGYHYGTGALIAVAAAYALGALGAAGKTSTDSRPASADGDRATEPSRSRVSVGG